jgi:hypothetical protein
MDRPRTRRTTANREALARKRAEGAIRQQAILNQKKAEAAARKTARLQANILANKYRAQGVNRTTVCELFWFNGATSFTHGMGRRRVNTESHPGYLLKFRSAPRGTASRILTKLFGLDHIFRHRDPDDWLSNMYEEVKYSVQNLKKVVIAGHSHGGLISTIMAENLANDPDITNEDRAKVYVVTFNSIRLVNPSHLKGIKIWQIVNVGDVARFVSRGGPPFFGNYSQPVTNVNNVLWNHNRNFTWKFTSKTTHSYINHSQGVRWLWRRNTGRRGPIASHSDIDFDEFIDAVTNYFKVYVRKYRASNNYTRNIFKQNLPFANLSNTRFNKRNLSILLGNNLNSLSNKELGALRNKVYNASLNINSGNNSRLILNNRLRSINNTLRKRRTRVIHNN